jgi:prepilin-type N-terminal cleavage/methylation domain-containing protein
MNMILKKRLANRRGRGGFTLVEVIVVLVILAILAAIAIPALTGYIDKAEDKTYIAEARNATVAVRTMVNEAYANETLSKGNPGWITTGANMTGTLKGFDIITLTGALSQNDTGDPGEYRRRVVDLMGAEPPKSSSWTFHFYAPKTASYTVFNAPMVLYYTGKTIAADGEYVFVTYGVGGIDPKTIKARTGTNGFFNYLKWTYDPNAGYKVFHITSES